jgi:hypothetical protein
MLSNDQILTTNNSNFGVYRFIFKIGVSYMWFFFIFNDAKKIDQSPKHLFDFILF